MRGILPQTTLEYEALVPCSQLWGNLGHLPRWGAKSTFSYPGILKTKNKLDLDETFTIFSSYSKFYRVTLHISINVDWTIIKGANWLEELKRDYCCPSSYFWKSRKFFFRGPKCPLGDRRRRAKMRDSAQNKAWCGPRSTAANMPSDSKHTASTVFARLWAISKLT